MKNTGILACFALIALIAGTAAAQEYPLFAAGEKPDQAGDIGDPGRNDGRPSEEQREEIRRKMQAVRIMRLTEELNLDEKTAAKFIPAITSLEQKQRNLMRDNEQLMRDLRQTLAAKTPDQGKIRAALDKMFRNHQERNKLRDKEFEAARESLSVEQQARYVIFQHDFMQEMRGMLAGARGRGAGRGGMGPGGRGMTGGPLPGEPGQD